ncbi:hypothetical protein [Flavisphingomonas formosensis]|uniref:hypothetical protein n=1 Tax=Flavisphingomonas formosensis TaxID=861534 RepID=UPI0012F99C79|nr:hypothetical protein [Sphingomonas formosensis]
MRDTIIATTIVVAILSAHGAAMLWLWRRMKRVDAPEPEHRQPLVERANCREPDGRLYHSRRKDVSEG